MNIPNIVPILRIFDVALAKSFYLDFLGFNCDWEHQFEANFPKYLQVSKAQIYLHLSEHFGDACSGSSIRIHCPNVAEYQQQLLAQNYTYAKPGIEHTAWDTLEMKIHDPFGNRLIFWQDQ